MSARRLRRLEAAALEALLRQQAAWLAADLGGSATEYLSEVRRIHGVVQQVMADLPPSTRHDPRAIVRSLATTEGLDATELLKEAERIAAATAG